MYVCACLSAPPLVLLPPLHPWLVPVRQGVSSKRGTRGRTGRRCTLGEVECGFKRDMKREANSPQHKHKAILHKSEENVVVSQVLTQYCASHFNRRNTDDPVSTTQQKGGTRFNGQEKCLPTLQEEPRSIYGKTDLCVSVLKAPFVVGKQIEESVW
jgi:hypothetical protein